MEKLNPDKGAAPLPEFGFPSWIVPGEVTVTKDTRTTTDSASAVVEVTASLSLRTGPAPAPVLTWKLYGVWSSGQGWSFSSEKSGQPDELSCDFQTPNGRLVFSAIRLAKGASGWQLTGRVKPELMETLKPYAPDNFGDVTLDGQEMRIRFTPPFKASLPGLECSVTGLRLRSAEQGGIGLVTEFQLLDNKYRGLLGAAGEEKRLTVSPEDHPPSLLIPGVARLDLKDILTLRFVNGGEPSMDAAVQMAPEPENPLRSFLPDVLPARLGGTPNAPVIEPQPAKPLNLLTLPGLGGTLQKVTLARDAAGLWTFSGEAEAKGGGTGLLGRLFGTAGVRLGLKASKEVFRLETLPEWKTSIDLSGGSRVDFSSLVLQRSNDLWKLSGSAKATLKGLPSPLAADIDWDEDKLTLTLTAHGADLGPVKGVNVTLSLSEKGDETDWKGTLTGTLSSAALGDLYDKAGLTPSGDENKPTLTGEINPDKLSLALTSVPLPKELSAAPELRFHSLETLTLEQSFEKGVFTVTADLAMDITEAIPGIEAKVKVQKTPSGTDLDCSLRSEDGVPISGLDEGLGRLTLTSLNGGLQGGKPTLGGTLHYRLPDALKQFKLGDASLPDTLDLTLTVKGEDFSADATLPSPIQVSLTQDLSFVIRGLKLAWQEKKFICGLKGEVGAWANKLLGSFTVIPSPFSLIFRPDPTVNLSLSFDLPTPPGQTATHCDISNFTLSLGAEPSLGGDVKVGFDPKGFLPKLIGLNSPMEATLEGSPGEFSIYFKNLKITPPSFALGKIASVRMELTELGFDSAGDFIGSGNGYILDGHDKELQEVDMKVLAGASPGFQLHFEKPFALDAGDLFRLRWHGNLDIEEKFGIPVMGFEFFGLHIGDEQNPLVNLDATNFSWWMPYLPFFDRFQGHLSLGGFSLDIDMEFPDPASDKEMEAIKSAFTLSEADREAALKKITAPRFALNRLGIAIPKEVARLFKSPVDELPLIKANPTKEEKEYGVKDRYELGIADLLSAVSAIDVNGFVIALVKKCISEVMGKHEAGFNLLGIELAASYTLDENGLSVKGSFGTGPKKKKPKSPVYIQWDFQGVIHPDGTFRIGPSESELAFWDGKQWCTVADSKMTLSTEKKLDSGFYYDGLLKIPKVLDIQGNGYIRPDVKTRALTFGFSGHLDTVQDGSGLDCEVTFDPSGLDLTGKVYLESVKLADGKLAIKDGAVIISYSGNSGKKPIDPGDLFDYKFKIYVDLKAKVDFKKPVASFSCSAKHEKYKKKNGKKPYDKTTFSGSFKREGLTCTFTAKDVTIGPTLHLKKVSCSFNLKDGSASVSYKI